MIYGYTSNSERVSATNANRDEEYFCPGCKAKLVLKQGEIRTWHFAHSTGTLCSAFTENKMTEWHLAHQMLFPEECREIRLEKDGIVHIADIKQENLIVEFQHSPIDNETFEERTNFYSRFGHLVWVIDCIEKWEKDAIKAYEDPKTHRRWFEWDHASKVLGKYDFKMSNFDLFIELDRSGWGCLVEWNPAGMRRFSGRLFNQKELMQYFKNIRDRLYAFSKLYPLPREHDQVICENEKIVNERKERELMEAEQARRESMIAFAREELKELYPTEKKLAEEKQSAWEVYSCVAEKYMEVKSRIEAAEAVLQWQI